MNWGYKILIVYLVFVVMMLGMVYVSSKQTNEMQDENYYAKELKYQDVIDGKNNLNALKDTVSITAAAGVVKIKIPEETAVDMSDAKIYFLRPSDKRKDLDLALVVDKNGEQLISISNLSNGIYTVQLSWKSNQKMYYSEQTLNVQE